jgi:hypothetical protein
VTAQARFHGWFARGLPPADERTRRTERGDTHVDVAGDL